MAEYRNPKPTVDALPRDLCFDHGTILSDSRACKRTGQRRKL